jgi:hypothetical protein
MFVYLGYVFVSDGDAVDTGVSEREVHCLAILAIEAALATNRRRNPGGAAAVNLREIAGHPREQQPRGRMECDRQHSRNRHGKSLGEWSDSRTEPASQDYVTVKFM